MNYPQLERLIEIIKTLRSENGCPWDREQTHYTLKKNIIEEAYETVDAIEDGDTKHLKEELGDVLLQVVLHAQIAQEENEFTPCQTLTNKELQMLRDSALKIIRALKIEGGCNVQFALDPFSFKYYLIEVNPRVSRSSALASKASGYPIARVTAKIAVGMHLDEIKLAAAPACIEPALDYIVAKVARFPFDKFATASNKLSTQMKATGEVMSIGRTVEESLLKAIRSLEIGAYHLYLPKFDGFTTDELVNYISDGHDDRMFAIAQLIRNNVDLGVIYNHTKIDMLFLYKFKNII